VVAFFVACCDAWVAAATASVTAAASAITDRMRFMNCSLR
jgi:hypothetical protein